MNTIEATKRGPHDGHNETYMVVMVLVMFYETNAHMWVELLTYQEDSVILGYALIQMILA